MSRVDESDVVLEIRDLKAHLFVDKSVVRAVDGVSFTIRKGETLALVGESGCGKSMTALAIMGLLPRPAGRIVSGSVMLAGYGDLTRLAPSEMRSLRGRAVSMIFQEPMTSLNPVFRIGWQICEALRVHEPMSREQARARAIALLEMVGIPSPELRYHSFPHQLSGGMRQRVMIAIALACGPRLMLADEPTTALDVTIQAQILRLMNRLKGEAGASLLMITHDLGVVAKTAQRVCVMYAGVIVEQSAVTSLFASPLHPYTQGLLASIPGTGPHAKAKLHSIPGSVPSLAALAQGCRFADRCAAVHPRCREAEPPLIATDATREVRCWLYAGAAA